MASVSIKKTQSVNVTDWGKFHEYILETGNLALLHKRVSSGACLEHIEAGETLPGIEQIEVSDLSLTKTKR
jgi:hypothetical protein